MESRGLDVVHVLGKLGGVASASELAHYCGRARVDAAVAASQVVRVARGRYAVPEAGDAFVAAARLGGVVAGPSAALHWGWKVKHSPAQPVVLLPRGRKRTAEHRAGATVWWGDAAADDMRLGRVTSPRRTLLDCLRRLPYDEALSIADSALRNRALSKAELLALAETSPRVGRARAIGVAEAADRRAANPFESCLRAICHQVEGLAVEPQHPVADVGHVDLGDPVLMLAIEADSHEFHSDKRAFRYDVRRYTAMVRHRWRVVRFVHEDVMANPEYVAAVLADLVAQGPPNYGHLVVPGRDPRLNLGA